MYKYPHLAVYCRGADKMVQPGFIPTGDFQLRFSYLPVKTTGANRAFAEDFIGIFSANSNDLCNFLEFIDASKVERKRKNENEKTEKSDKVEYSTAIYDTLLELYLQDDENDTEEMWRAKRAKAKQLLARKDDIRFDKNHALLVCQMYGYNDGIICLYKQLNLPTQVAQNYMEQDDYQKLIKCCKKYGKTHPRMWVSALMYFADKPAKGVASYIKEVLEHIAATDQLAPIEAVEILSNSAEKHELDVIKVFLVSQLQKVQEKVRAEYAAIRSHISKIAETKQQIYNYQTKAQKFTSGIEPPSFYFLGTTKGGVGDENEELKERSVEMATLEERTRGLKTIDYPRFLEALDSKTNPPFEKIAEYLQKRVFDKPEQGSENTFDPDLFSDLGLVSLDKL